MDLYFVIYTLDFLLMCNVCPAFVILHQMLIVQPSRAVKNRNYKSEIDE
jgi:hypothetical protein